MIETIMQNAILALAASSPIWITFVAEMTWR